MDRLQKQKQANTDLKHAQLEGKIPTVTANMDDSVQIPANEAHLFHVSLTKKRHDPVKKKYVTENKSLTLSQQDITQMDTHNGQGWEEWDEHVFLHDPRKAEKKKAK